MKAPYAILLNICFLSFTLSQVQLGSDIDGEAAGDKSGGFAISLDSDGNRLAIGAPYNDGGGADAGHVRIYSWNGISWSQLGADIDGEATGDLFGRSVSLDSDGDRVAIGAILNDGNGTEAGHVRIYSWNGSNWSQLGADIDGESAGDRSGWSISLDSDGDRVAIGAVWNDGTASNAGHVRIYSWNGSSWSQLGADINGEAAGDHSGFLVSLDSDGDRVAIGAYFNDGTASNAGHVRIYSWNGSSWSQLGADIDGEAANDLFGAAVSLDSDGDRVAIGAYANDGGGSDAGHVRVFSWNGSSWSQLGADIDGEAAGDQSGISVSLDSDGDRLAIGGWGNDGGGSNAGHVRIYSWNGSSWNHLGTDINGEVAGDGFGRSVSLDSDGDRLAIGSHLNDGGGTDAGHVRVYNTSDAMLPVELTSFDLIESRNESITLQWVTESEINNLGFILDKRTSTVDWTQIASYVTNQELQGQGNTSHQTIYKYIDNDIRENETYDYRLADVDYGGNIEYHSLQLMGVSTLSTLPGNFILHQNYPNPFNPNTTISYEIPEGSNVEIIIYDKLGNVVKNLSDNHQPLSHKSMQWNARNNQGEFVSAGVYFFKINAGKFTDTKKMVLIK